LNKNPRAEEFLILVCASSQIKKRRSVAQKLGFAKETLVLVSPNEYKHFSKDTVIDCNKVIEKNSRSLIEKLEGGKLRPCSESMSKEIIEKLVSGVLASNQVAEGIKKMIADS
jgi:hypothetical protein